MNSNYKSNLFSAISCRWWMVAAPLLLSLAVVLAYTSHVKLYESKAIVMFDLDTLPYSGSAGAEKEEKELHDRVANITGALLFGDSVRKIIAKAYPEVKNEIAKNNLIQRISSASGVRLAFRKDNYRALEISYTASSAQEAHDVVAAIVGVLKDQVEVSSESKFENNAKFLQTEIEKYRGQMSEIEREILTLRSNLGGPLSSFDAGASRDSALLSEMLGSANGSSRPISLVAVEAVPQMKMELELANKEVSRITAKIEKLTEEGVTLQSSNDSELGIRELESMVINKQQKLASLSAKGLMPAHPSYKSASRELASAKALLASHKKSSEKSNPKTEQLVNLNIDLRLAQKTAERLADRISVIENIHGNSEGKEKSLDAVAAAAGKLSELQQRKLALADAIHTTTIELEVIQRHQRAIAHSVGLQMSVEEQPSMPTSPVPFAHISTILMTATLSLISGIGFASLADWLDNSIKTIDDLEEVSGIRTVGSIEEILSSKLDQSRKFNRFATVSGILVASILAHELAARFWFS